MKNYSFISKLLAVGMVFGCAFVANAEKISKHTVDGFEEWYWKTTVKVSRGSAHTFWITGLTENTAITDMEVLCEYTYTEDGETIEDYVFASESCEIENSSGGFDKYVLLTAEDWDWVPSSKSSLTFTVMVSGWGDDDYTTADMSFKFGHSDGESAYPGEQEPVYVAPKGTQDNPQTFTVKETSRPDVEASMISCELGEDFGGTYYIKTPNLVAGHKYFFGIDSGSELAISTGVGGDNLFKNEAVSKAYEGFTSCTEAYSFVAPASGVFWITVQPDGDFTFYCAALPALTPDKHEFTDLSVGTESEEFAPGYLNDPESGAFDAVIDQRLFRITGYRKGDNIVFRTEGAANDLLMRLYDAKGNILAESRRMSDDNQEVSIAWTATAAYSAASAVYLGVCQQLADDEEPSAGTVTISAQIVTLATKTTPVAVIPDGKNLSPEKVDGAVPSEERTLSATEWVDTFVIAARAGITYRVKAVNSETHGLNLAANLYTVTGSAKKELPASFGVTGSLDPNSSGWLEFTPQSHGNIYIDVCIADGDYGAGVGLEYGPYVLYASAAGSDLGILTVPMKGASQSLMGWKILSGPGITSSKEVFYAAGTSAILREGDYTIIANKVDGFAVPDTRGYTTVHVNAGTTPSAADEYKYADTADPLDDSPDAKAKHPSLGRAYAPTKLAPTATRSVEVVRSLWDDDPADWFTLAANAGSVYRFGLSGTDGAPKMAVYGPDDWTKECEYVSFKDAGEMLQISTTTKGMYYVKVGHADDSGPVDSAYTLTASMATPGVIKLAKTTISVKDTAGYADVSVSRTGKDGIVRVKFATVGCQTSADDAYYYPTNGVLTWAAGDMKAKTVRVRIIQNSGWSTNKTINVVFSTFSDEDETFDIANEYVPGFETDKQTGAPLDTATITITPAAKKTPGTIQVAECATPKKPVLSVTAGKTIDIPFERVLGADGIIGVKVETVKGTANKSGETDFEPVNQTLIWGDGEKDVKTVSIQTKAVADDYTATKTFSLKLTALTSARNDATQYDRPTFAATSVTVNIANDKFADTLANYAKVNSAALKSRGISFRESKTGTWYMNADGSIFTLDGKNTLTFTMTEPGTLTVNGEEYEITLMNKSVTIKDVTKIDSWNWTSYADTLDKEPLYQGVKTEIEVAGEEITAIKVTGKLPDGLKLEQDKKTKKWLISGVPSKAGVYTPIIQPSRKEGSKTIAEAPIQLAYDVADAGSAIGTFTGLASTFDATNGLPTLAQVTFTASANGKLSAKAAIGGKTYTFTDSGYADVIPGDDVTPTYYTAELLQLQRVTVESKSVTLTNMLSMTVAAVAETNTIAWTTSGDFEIRMAALPDAKGTGFQEDVWYLGSLGRDNTKVASWVEKTAKFMGYYTVSLVPDSAAYGEPQGNGYMTMTIDAKGKAKVAGLLADGTSYSASSLSGILGTVGEAEIFRVPLYMCKGTSVFGGWLTVAYPAGGGNPVAKIDSPDTDFRWINDDPSSTRDGYEGFALSLRPVGGWYDTISNLQRTYLESDLFIDMPSGDDALADIMDALALGGDYQFVAQPSGQSVDVAGDAISVAKQILAKDASKKLNDWNSCVNASNVKLTFKRATGIVSGTFDLWYQGTNVKGAVEQKAITGLKHNGILLTECGDDGILDDGVVTSGFFLAPQSLTREVVTTIGSRTTTKTVTRKWNGSYRFDIKAVAADRVWSDSEQE